MSDEQKARVRRLTMWVGYPIFFTVTFFIFATLLFPYDKLRDYLVASFNAQQRATNGQFELKIDELHSWWFPGVKAKGIHVKSLASDPSKPPIELDIDDARARVSFFPLLIGHKNVNFSIAAFQGKIDGSVAMSDASRHIVVELDHVELGDVDMIGAQVGLPVTGKLSGIIDLTMPEGKASKGTGNVNLEGADIAIGDGKAKMQLGMMGEMAIPTFNVGPLKIVAEAKEGKLQVSQISAAGKDLDLNGEGKIQMREMAAESLCDLTVKFKVNDSYRGREDKTKTIFGEPGAKAGGLIDLDPKMKRAKQSDGFYAFRVGGKLGRLDPQPAGGGTSSKVTFP